MFRKNEVRTHRFKAKIQNLAKFFFVSSIAVKVRFKELYRNRLCPFKPHLFSTIFIFLCVLGKIHDYKVN